MPVKWSDWQTFSPDYCLLIYTTALRHLLQKASEHGFLMVHFYVSFLFMSLTLLMSSSSLKSVSQESLTGELFPDTEDTCCLLLIWLTPQGTSAAADTLPRTTLEREMFFYCSCLEVCRKCHGPLKVASHMCVVILGKSVWLWICDDCVRNHNSFLYWGFTKRYVFATEKHKKTHTLLADCTYFSGWAFTSCTRDTSFLQTRTQHNMTHLAMTTSRPPYPIIYFI
jgi:hypothetical protein